MQRGSWCTLVILAGLLGCTRPEVEAFRQRPTPIAVKVSLPEGLAERALFEKEYASALRARLATRVTVVPEGVTPPAGAAELRVEIHDVSPGRERPSAAAVGVAAGVTVGALSAASGNRGWGIVDGLFWGLWAGTHAAAHRDHTRNRLGYIPQVVRAQVRLVREGLQEPLWVTAIEPVEVVEAMDPLPPGLREDDGRIREEEARGFARAVVQKLSVDFQWTRLSEQRFYEAPGTRKDDPPAPKPAEPGPEPKKD